MCACVRVWGGVTGASVPATETAPVFFFAPPELHSNEQLLVQELEGMRSELNNEVMLRLSLEVHQ